MFFKKIFLLVIILISGVNSACYATSTCDKQSEVTFIYIHGVCELDEPLFNSNVRQLHSQFSGKKLGNYVISANYKKIYWGHLPFEGKSYQVFKQGLLEMNTEHNFWKVKRTVDPKLSLLLNPINRLFLIGDMGSKSNAVFFRNFINNYIYQLGWVLFDVNNSNVIFDMFQKKIEEIDGKYVIVAHSLGSAISSEFVRERVLLNVEDEMYEPKVKDNFVGLITSGDVNNTFRAIKFANELQTPKDEPEFEILAKYFSNNDKFWISYNHRNDLFATKIASQVTEYTSGFNFGIVSEVNKEFPFQAFVDFLKVKDRNGNIFEAHQYMFKQPKSFANGVLKIYDKNFNKKASY